MVPRDSTRDASAKSPPLSSAVRYVASAAILLHVFTVFVGPFSLGPPSPLALELRNLVRPYLEMTGRTDHGYRFFASQPGPSHLIRWRVEYDDGRPALEGRLPDRQVHWPRLYYHRHFMLTEFLNVVSVPHEPPQDSEPGTPEYELWKQERETLGRVGEAYTRSYARHLLQRHSGQRVTLWGQTRRLPTTQQVREGMPIDSAELLIETELGTYTRRELAIESIDRPSSGSAAPHAADRPANENR
jgi:hypothetical protein